MTENMPEMFQCARRSLRLTRAGCGRLWLSAQDFKPGPWEGRAECRSCPVGAENAGRSVPVTAGAVEQLQPLCPRCLRPSDRMIRKRLCVSCYNREREALIGKNAKGGRPLLSDQLHTQTIAIIANDQASVTEFPSVTGLLEVIVAAARSAAGPIAFGRPARSMP